MILVRKLESRQETQFSGYGSEALTDLFSSSQSSFFELDNITPSAYINTSSISATKTLRDLHKIAGAGRVVEGNAVTVPVAPGISLDNIKLSECNVQNITCKCTKNIYLNVSSYAISQLCQVMDQVNISRIASIEDIFELFYNTWTPNIQAQ